jgi:hypothetical protein
MTMLARSRRAGLAALAMLAAAVHTLPGAAQSSRSELAALGTVDRVQGEATLLRGSRTSPVLAGQPVASGDTLSTAGESRLLLVFTDGTQLTLGERAEAFIDHFVYNPLKKSGAAFVDIVRGAFRFTAGRIREFSDKRIEVRTGSATLAADGSDFWGGPVDNAYGVLLLDGRIEVRNGAGMVLMHKKRLGSTIAAPGAAPEMPVRWNKHQVSKAVATVAFK